MIDLVKSLPVHITDATMRAMLTVGSAMIQMEMIFDHRLDERRLARAADLLLDAEPVVGCRMVERGWRMRWMRLPEAERAKAYAELDAFTYEQFKLVEIDAFDEGPRVLVRLFRDKDGDRVLVKFDHHIGDAGGLKQVVETLAKLYRSLEGKPDFYPVPNLDGDRGVGQLFRVLPISSWPTILLEYLRFARKSLVPAQQFPLADGNDGPVGYVVRHFDLHRIRAMQEYGRRHKATLNDVFVTAFLRTIRHISEWDGARELRATMTVDLRRYLPGERTGGPCNLSGFEMPSLGKEPGETFDDTLAKVASQLTERKENWPGVPVYMLAPTMGWLPIKLQTKLFGFVVRDGIRKGTTPPALTNMGPIAKERVLFDEAPRYAYLLPPIGRPPAFISGLSGYEGAMSFCIGTRLPGLSPELAERIAERMDAELPGEGGVTRE